MQRLPEIVRRNRRVIMSITAIVILPSAVLCFLAFRAVRTENVQQQFQQRQRQRQRQIALLLEAELKKWLFSGGQDGAISQALLRFHISGEQIVFPSLAISIPPRKGPLVRYLRYLSCLTNRLSLWVCTRNELP